ncbi:unnamed protein product [Durusdinium trenchii]|uniref:Uncharacterized protein n=1 Tax=Durusdinium trenchii TaxID=1381693 RepID=A0ABP0SE22_9DINO
MSEAAPASQPEAAQQPDEPSKQAPMLVEDDELPSFEAAIAAPPVEVAASEVASEASASEKPKLPEKSEKAQTKRKMEPIPLAQLAQTMAEQRAKMSRGDGGSAAPVLAKKMPTPPPKVVVDLEDADS